MIISQWWFLVTTLMCKAQFHVMVPSIKPGKMCSFEKVLLHKLISRVTTLRILLQFVCCTATIR